MFFASTANEKFSFSTWRVHRPFCLLKFEMLTTRFFRTFIRHSLYWGIPSFTRKKKIDIESGKAEYSQHHFFHSMKTHHVLILLDIRNYLFEESDIKLSSRWNRFGLINLISCHNCQYKAHYIIWKYTLQECVFFYGQEYKVMPKGYVCTGLYEITIWKTSIQQYTQRRL